MALFEKRFPRIKGRYTVTSDRTSDYNCFAFAADERQQNVVWSPGANGLAPEFWPEGIPRTLTIDAFVKAYATFGYELCGDGDLHEHLEKVALYTANGIPLHAARQLPSGAWKSKIGFYEDIEHQLGDLEGDDYGAVTHFLARPRSLI